jgi:hypothetical protein
MTASSLFFQFLSQCSIQEALQHLSPLCRRLLWGAYETLTVTQLPKMKVATMKMTTHLLKCPAKHTDELAHAAWCVGESTVYTASLWI